MTIEELWAQVDTLAAEVRGLKDEAAIIRLLYEYGHALDYGDEAGWVDLFTEDAVWYTTRSNMRNVGRQELAEFVAGHTRPPELFHKHLISQPKVDVDGDTATAVCYLTLLVRIPDSGLPQTVAFGRYLDRLVRDTDGKWRIVERRAEGEGFDPVWSELRNIRRRKLGGEHSTD